MSSTLIHGREYFIISDPIEGNFEMENLVPWSGTFRWAVCEDKNKPGWMKKVALINPEWSGHDFVEDDSPWIKNVLENIEKEKK